jgi:peptide-methionine (S)-S-oxide reductase
MKKFLLLILSIFLISFVQAQASTSSTASKDTKIATEKKTMKKEIATLAGGCFWGVEEIIRAIPGVTNTTVGYTGGSVDNPNYNIVKLGTSNHAESIEVEFNPENITYSEILGYFFRLHDPTTLNQQGNDKGTQYRSAIFYHTPEQKRIAEETIEKVNQAKKWPKPIVTQVVPATKFYPAEEYHQDYLQKNKGGYTCHWLRD